MKVDDMVKEFENLNSSQQFEFLQDIGFEDKDPQEKIGAEYAYEAFKDISNWDEFQEKLREINNTRLNYMQPIGL